MGGHNYIIAAFPFSHFHFGTKKRVCSSCVKLLQIVRRTMSLMWQSISSTMSLMYFDSSTSTTLAEAERFIISNLIFVVPEMPPHACVKTSLGDFILQLTRFSVFSAYFFICNFNLCSFKVTQLQSGSSDKDNKTNCVVQIRG